MGRVRPDVSLHASYCVEFDVATPSGKGGSWRPTSKEMSKRSS